MRGCWNFRPFFRSVFIPKKCGFSVLASVAVCSFSFYWHLVLVFRKYTSGFSDLVINVAFIFSIWFPVSLLQYDLNLMLWRAKTTQDGVVGNSGQGMYWQGSDKPTDWIKTHRMGASVHGAMPRGCPMPLLQGGHCCWNNHVAPS